MSEEMNVQEQIAILRSRVEDYRTQIAELEAKHPRTSLEDRHLLSLQAQIQDDQAVIRKHTGA